tara:strand:- start:1210 stop:1884 length:675 start_codon:yes stop_codon:yes gene_type:complete
MPNINPDIDNFTNNINDTIPSVTENLSPKLRKSRITGSIDLIKGDICNKVDGAVNIFTSIKTGAFSVFSSIKNFDLNNFFEGPAQNLTGKITDVTLAFESAFDSFRGQDLSLENKSNNQLNKIDLQQVQRFESSKISKGGFKNSFNRVKNLSNKSVRDFNLDPNAKKSFKDILCNQAKNDMINNALNQKSISSLSFDQANLINKSSQLININDLNEIRSPYEII